MSKLKRLRNLASAAAPARTHVAGREAVLKMVFSTAHQDTRTDQLLVPNPNDCHQLPFCLTMIADGVKAAEAENTGIRCG